MSKLDWLSLLPLVAIAHFALLEPHPWLLMSAVTVYGFIQYLDGRNR